MLSLGATFTGRFRVDRAAALGGTVALGLLGALSRQFGNASTHASTADAGASAPRDAAALEQRFACPVGMAAIRGGEFTMGDGLDLPHDRRHRARVSPFCLDEREVTVARFREFWNAGYPPPSGAVRYPGGSIPWTTGVTEPDQRTRGSRCTWTRTPGDHEDHPINCVGWYTMQAYCAWRGGRLPTEAEWEFAARGIDVQTYPWGNEAPTGARLNAHGEEGRSEGWGVMPDYGRDPFPGTAPVGSFPATRPPGVFFGDDTGAGLYDMAGNVWEWVADGYADYPATTSTVPVDPITEGGTLRVLRGGGWDHADPSQVRAARRIGIVPDYRYSGWGGRCAREVR